MAGVILTILGFVVTVAQIKKVKSASEAVSFEVNRIRQSLARYDAGQEIAKAQYALTSAKRHLRNEAWLDVADSYEDVRRAILQFKSLMPCNDDEIMGRIDEASSHIEKLCARIELGLSKPPLSVNVQKTHTMMRRHGELIASIAFELEKDLV